MGKINAMHASKVKPGIHLLFLMGRQVLSHPRTAGPQHGQQLLGNTNITTPNTASIFLFLPTAFYAEQDATRCGISLGSVRISCPGCVPSKILVHPQPPHGQGGGRSRNGLDSGQALLSTNKTTSTTNTLFSINPKHSLLLATF